MTMGRMVKLATIRSFPRIIFLPNRNFDQAVDFINCADTEEYREYGFLQNIYLGDAVRVIAPRIGGKRRDCIAANPALL